MTASISETPLPANRPVSILKKRADFLRLRKARRHSSKFFTVQAAKASRQTEEIKVGFTVTTKVGNAVVRNRIKRRLRDVTKTILGVNGKPDFDYVVIARRASIAAEFESLKKDFLIALDHLHKNGAKGTGQQHA